MVSGSSDNTIRLWDIECGACLRVLEGHEELVRCIRFDSKRIVSGAYDGKIKVRSEPNINSIYCILTLIQLFHAAGLGSPSCDGPASSCRDSLYPHISRTFRQSF